MQKSSMHPGSRKMHPETLDFSDEDDLSNVNVKSLVSWGIQIEILSNSNKNGNIQQIWPIWLI